MPIKKRRRVRLNSSPAGRPGRYSLTPVKGKKKAATKTYKAPRRATTVRGGGVAKMGTSRLRRRRRAKIS